MKKKQSEHNIKKTEIKLAVPVPCHCNLFSDGNGP